jgi:hypothetical protein
MYGMVSLYWGVILFDLGCILECGCYNLLWLGVCVGVSLWVLYCVGVLVKCVLVFAVFCIVLTVFLILFVYVY